VRAVALCTVLLVVACDDPRPGLSLEVIVNDAAISRVELFVGAPCSDDAATDRLSRCPAQFAPPDMQEMAIDRVFLVSDPVPWSVATMGASSVGFRIATGEHPHTIGIIHVVGYDAQDAVVSSGTIYDYELEPGTAETGRIVLRRTIALDAPVPSQPAGTRRMRQWRSGSLPSCVLAERWPDETAPLRDLIVPVTDPDCDEQVDECAPWVVDAHDLPASVEHASCLAYPPNGAPPAVCLVGGDPCTDGITASVQRCAPLDERYCAPDVVCGSAAYPYDAAAMKEILTDAFNSILVMPHLDCIVGVTSETGQPCPSTTSATGIDAEPILGQATCTGAALHPLEPPLAPTRSLALDGSTLHIRTVQTSCKLEVQLDSSPAALTAFGWVSLSLTTGNHLFLPLRLVQHTERCEALSCKFAGDPNRTLVDRCASSPPPPSASCAPSPNCADGPSCGVVCCRRGEWCDNGICRCGTGDSCLKLAGADAFCQQADSADPSSCGSRCCGGTGPQCVGL
jgi:hypothetical protein